MPYHLMSRGNAKQCIFEDEDDHLRFLELLAKVLERFSVACLAYCLLWNHFHLLVVPTLHTVSRLMQDLNSQYCQAFNRRHRRVGHVLGDRFKGPLIDSDSYLLTALRYIALNPVESGRVTQPEDWRWSSFRALAGLEPSPPFLCRDRVWTAFDTDDPLVGQERFVAFVRAQSVGDGMTNLESALFIGGPDLGRRIDPLLRPHRGNADFSYAQRFATRPPLSELLDVPDHREAIVDAARIAFCEHAYTLREIGSVLHRPVATIWAWIKEARERRTEDPERTHPAQSSTARTRRGQISIFE